MTDSPWPKVASVPRADFDPDASSGPAAGVRRVVEAATAADGRSPMDEQSLLSLRHEGLSSSSLWVSLRQRSTNGQEDAGLEGPTPDEAGLEGPTSDGGGLEGPTPDGGAKLVGFALVDAEPGAAEVEMNLVVDPAYRGKGVGSELAAAALAEFPSAKVSAWSHGNHPAASSLADRLGFARVRDLWIMRLLLSRGLVAVEPGVSSGRAGSEFAIRTFQPGTDEVPFLEVNAAAFAHHPEQGGMTRADLEQRMAEPWFDPSGLFIAASYDGRMLGFHWTKVHDADPAYGEVYVVGVSPEAQGTGLGKQLTLTGLRHLQSLGLDEVILYVEPENRPAVAVYRGLGFTHDDQDTDVMYARSN